MVDEDLENFKEIYDWMDAIVPVHDPSSYSTLTKSTSTQSKLYQKAESDLAQMSDITLVINTNKNIPNKFFRFHDAFPINLENLSS